MKIETRKMTQKAKAEWERAKEAGEPILLAHYDIPEINPQTGSEHRVNEGDERSPRLNKWVPAQLTRRGAKLSDSVYIIPTHMGEWVENHICSPIRALPWSHKKPIGMVLQIHPNDMDRMLAASREALEAHIEKALASLRRSLEGTDENGNLLEGSAAARYEKAEKNFDAGEVMATRTFVKQSFAKCARRFAEALESAQAFDFTQDVNEFYDAQKALADGMRELWLLEKEAEFGGEEWFVDGKKEVKAAQKAKRDAKKS